MTPIIIIGLTGLVLGATIGFLAAAMWAAHHGLKKDSDRG